MLLIIVLFNGPPLPHTFLTDKFGIKCPYLHTYLISLNFEQTDKFANINANSFI